ncbi:MAG: hypothetical protein ACE5KI_01385 [Dehalococcoidia bacterium]
MRAIVGVRLERAGRVQYFEAGGLKVEVNDYVVVERGGEERIGRVVISPDRLVIDQLGVPIAPILRKATPEDLKNADPGWVRP